MKEYYMNHGTIGADLVNWNNPCRTRPEDASPEQWMRWGEPDNPNMIVDCPHCGQGARFYEIEERGCCHRCEH